MSKVIIAGSRDFDDFELLCEICDLYLQNHNDVEIVSGTARGVDQLGEAYAKSRRYNIKKFIPIWNVWGKAADYKRNSEKAEYADALIAFWNERSKGTMHMIDLAKRKPC